MTSVPKALPGIGILTFPSHDFDLVKQVDIAALKGRGDTPCAILSPLHSAGVQRGSRSTAYCGRIAKVGHVNNITGELSGSTLQRK
ncbi:hypothetical protein RRG08_037110 [Elysia crispata]|uniref:Uncharacterized protein n=1 Tax=Elysia crispata TaxID=231223 RepID=A0AAE1CSQ9_9GAST|nr:hypothetical protein RRG08_037110 [Elysia crispata]